MRFTLRQFFLAIGLVGVILAAQQCYIYLRIPYREAELEKKLVSRMPTLPEKGIEEVFPLIDGTRYVARGTLEEPHPFSDLESPDTPYDFCWRLSRRRPITGLQIYKADLRDLDANVFRNFTHLSHIVIDLRHPSAHVSDSQISGLLAMPTLRSLRFDSVKLTPDHLSQISSNRDWRELILIDADLTDEDLGALSRMDQLHTIDLRKNSIGGSALERLPECAPNLRKLTLSNCPLDDDDLKPLAKLQHLEVLLMNEVPMTDAGMEHLSACPSLKLLRIIGSGITAKSGPILANMKSLKQVEMYGSSFHRDQATRLKQRRPDMSIGAD